LESGFALGTGKHKGRVLAKAGRKATEVVYRISYIVREIEVRNPIRILYFNVGRRAYSVYKYSDK